MPVEWLGGFSRRYVTNRSVPRRPQLGSVHSKPVDTILLHSTEGSTAAGAFGAYDSRAGRYSSGVHPHLTVDPYARQRFQHIPLTRSAYALKAGNRDGIIQIEIVGFAAKGWTVEQYRWLGEEVIRPIIDAIPAIPLRAPFPFRGPEAGLLARPWPHGKARVSPTNWANVSGIVGHQHAPYDDHWDPGAINIAAILDAASGSAPHIPDTSGSDLEDDMLTIRHDTTMNWYWSVDPSAPDPIKEIEDPAGLKLEGVPIQRSASMRHLMKHHWGVTTFAGKSF